MINVFIPKSNFIKKSVSFLAVSFLILDSTSAVKEEFPLIDQDATEVQVSKKGMNRLSVKEDRIAKIILTDDRLQYDLDEDQGQLFFKMNGTGEDSVDITLITEKGLTHDVTLMPCECESKSIIFEPEVVSEEEDEEEGGQGDRLEPSRRKTSSVLSRLTEDGPLRGASDAYTDQITSLMHAMVNETSVSGFKVSSCYLTDRNYKDKNLSIKALKSYKNSLFEGRSYEIKNIGPDPIIIREKEFAKSGDCAIAFSKDHLEHGDSLRLYVISRKG